MSMIQLLTKNVFPTRSTLHYSLGLTLSVGNGNFDSTHTKDLATDGERDTFASANPASNGDTVTITCMFKKTYHVKSVTTWVTEDMSDNIEGALFQASSNKRSFSVRYDSNEYPRKENMDDDGDRIIFQRQGEIQLREVKVRIEDEGNFKG